MYVCSLVKVDQNGKKNTTVKNAVIIASCEGVFVTLTPAYSKLNALYGAFNGFWVIVVPKEANGPL